MNYYFDLDKLKARLEDFYRVTKIRIAVLDTNFVELMAYPAERAKICDFIRSNPDADRDCFNCDQRACSAAAQKKTPHTYRCHIGLAEIISPLIIADTVIGYLFFTNILSYPTKQDGWQAIWEKCKKYGINEADLKTLCYSMPLCSEEFIRAAAHLLQAIASYLCMEKFAFVKYDDLAVRVNRYLIANLSQKMTVDDISKELGVNKSQLNAVTKEVYGKNLAQHIKNMRIEKAKSMLSLTNTSVSEIANLCGFSDYNYFISVFRQETGLTPKKYALKHKFTIK